MKVEISDGELLDKFSILEIKIEKIKDPSKLHNIKKEHKELLENCDSLLKIHKLSLLYLDLKSVNQKLWKIEDDIRELERIKNFGDEFISLARQVYFTNDERSRIKKEINLISGSSMIEEKSYESY